jgi:hypothetical protein
VVTEYPNKEHENAERRARRRALDALVLMIENAQHLARDLNGWKDVDMERGQSFPELSAKVTANLAMLETLRDVREWHAADVAEGRVTVS